MAVRCRWGVLLITLWIQVGFVPEMLCKDGTASPLSREDVLLVKDQQIPNCFTRTEEDFTCFFESPDNRTYDLLYKSESVSTVGRLSMSAQRTEEGTFLHICTFPESDVYLYVEMSLEVVEHDTSIILHSRNVSVENHILLDPPFNVSLHQHDQAGQLLVSWDTLKTQLYEDVMHKIQYSSKGQGERTKTDGNIIDSLPGEEVQVQVSIKCRKDGNWSRWSHPVQHMVPQSADDVSLICFTPDLQNITCQWNGSEYGEENGYTLFYKTRPSGTSKWTEWVHCLTNGSFSGACNFVGDTSREVLVKLSGRPSPLSRTFYTQTFTLNNSIKTPPPQRLSARLKKGSLCLQWDAPLPFLLAHLQYEVNYQTNRGDLWVSLFLEGPANDNCLEVQAGTQYSVKVRAKPTGSSYSGHWSDWSDVLTVDMPADLGTMLILCIPLLMIITAVTCMSLFAKYLSKIKQYFWPPVPNLDKVLQGFLAEISGQKWDLSAIEKQCPEETTPSMVEIMSEEDVSSLGNQSPESTQLLLPEGPFLSKEMGHWSTGTEMFPDYVTLNKDSSIICPKGNKYVYEQAGEKGESVVAAVLLKTCPCSCTDVTSCSCTEYLNHSYLPLAGRFTAARGPGNLYANFPCS